MYNKLAGMTGTAETEASEFAKTYNLDVIVIPTNKPMLRNDNADVIYKTEKGKFDAVIGEIDDCHKRGQPVLVGTISIEKSELLSSLLKKQGIRHSVLNAKYHDKEAEIIAQAGRSHAVTIATNMAGRGTDIILGGNPAGIAREMLSDKPEYTADEWNSMLAEAAKKCEADRENVLRAGGLHILGTERHEARRIDNQLRGRSGRQGDPGSSRFFLSLEDDLMRIFYSDRVSGLMGKLGMDDSMPIENKMVSKAIENAQKRVESQNFDIRKHLLEYDDVMNKQRTEIYAFRRDLLQGADVKDRILGMIDDALDELIAVHCPEDKHREDWDVKGLGDAAYGIFDFTLRDLPGTVDDLREMLSSEARKYYAQKAADIGDDLMRQMEKWILLQVVDSQWKDHLLAMDHLREGIGLRGYAQRDPLVEYKKEAFEMFSELSGRITTEVIMRLFKIQVQKNQEERIQTRQQKISLNYNRGEGGAPQAASKGKKTGRNEPCPCGSGKKYKKCCGVNE
jgi:preprotein translocase subunit SecA